MVQLPLMTGWAEATGYIASGLVFLSFCMKTLIPLRIVAIASNLAFIAYGFGSGLIPILVLHSALLPLNLIRTAQQIGLRNRVRSAANSEASLESLLPFMERRRCAPGEVIFRRGDHADFMFYLASGQIRLEEIGIVIEPGAVLGEIGLFANDGQRTATAVSVGRSEICVLTMDRVQSLFFENPEFGFFMIKLITGRLLENQERLEQKVEAATLGVSTQPAAVGD
jgi:CRP-like cAMP-binding protein